MGTPPADRVPNPTGWVWPGVFGVPVGVSIYPAGL
jgi:hypothetical protein